jgi:hypothetical protein
MKNAFHNPSEAASKWILRICVAFGAILTVFVGLMLYDLVSVLPLLLNTTQAKVVRPNQPAVRSGPPQLASAGRVKWAEKPARFEDRP